MDSFTHAIAAAGLGGALGLPALVPFAVLGSVIVDADALFSRLSDPHPALYLFTHGGIAHSFAGAAVMAGLAWAGIAIVGLVGLLPISLVVAAGPAGFAAVLSGAYLHVALDWLACPGLPLFAPFSDRKYTLGLLPGPSLLLLALSTAVLFLIGARVFSVAALCLPAVMIAGAFLAVRLAAFVHAHRRVRGAGRLVPTIDPRRWLVIGETPEAWSVGEYRVGKGTAPPVIHQTFQGISAREAVPYLETPQARRVRYHSYALTVTREGDAIVVADPVRESGLVRYPFDHVRARLPLVIPAGCPEDRP